jgi:hypothetical protein
MRRLNCFEGAGPGGESLDIPSINRRGGRTKLRRGKSGLFLLLIFSLLLVLSAQAEASGDRQVPKIGPVKINRHPASLEGKKVLLRWNGKYNGDKFLNRVGELLTQRIRKVNVVEMWKVDSSTAVISKKGEISEQIAAEIAHLKPDLVIASQAD